MRQLPHRDPVIMEALNEVVLKTDASATLTTKEMKNAVERCKGSGARASTGNAERVGAGVK
jgi:hypothetical protein